MTCCIESTSLTLVYSVFQSVKNQKVTMKSSDSKDDSLKANSGSVASGTIYITRSSENLLVQLASWIIACPFKDYRVSVSASKILFLISILQYGKNMFKNFKVSIRQVCKKTACAVISPCFINVSYTLTVKYFRCAKYVCTPLLFEDLVSY